MAGVKVPTIRFYEQIGLLPVPMRTGGKQRRYDPGTVERLTFIRHCRDLGFDIDEIRELLRLADEPDATCESVDALARQQVARIDAKLKRLRAMRRELVTTIVSCAGTRIRDCRILGALSEQPPARSIKPLRPSPPARRSCPR